MADNLASPPPARNLVAPNLTAVLPDYLREMQRWTTWAFKGMGAGKKPAKFPHTLTNDRSTWKSYGEALALAESRGAGMGLQMMGATSFVGLDLDGCVDPSTGAPSSFARALLGAIPGSYAEVTPSGKGLRIFASIPEGMKVPEFLSRQHGVECYTGRSARFLTITGNVLPGRERLFGSLTPEALALLAPLAASSGTAGAGDLELKLPVPQLERVVQFREVLDRRLVYGKLPAGWRSYLEEGAPAGARSETTFAIICKLLEHHYSADEVFLFIVSAPGTWEAALDKRDQDPTRTRALLWSDIGRAQRLVRAGEDDLRSRSETWAALGLKTSTEAKRLIVQRSPMNALRIFTGHEEWKHRLALDVTTGRVLLDTTPLDDGRLFALQEKICGIAGWEPTFPKQFWTDALRAAAEANPVNPRERELRLLQWDGVQRLDSWFTGRVTARDTSLDRDLGRKWLISLVARWIEPGCKVDTVLILQGLEGARKNTFFETIAGGVERVVAIDGMERDDKMTVAQAWIAEMPEASLFRRADRNRLKSFITQPIDQYRPPYASNPVAVKRAFVLVSTANPGALFNADQDGLRRFWPVEVRRPIDYQWIAEHREQLLAEALVCYDLGETWWFDETPAALRDRVADAAELTDVDEAIIDLIGKQRGKGGLTLNEIMLEVSATLGHRPQSRTVTLLLEKHEIRHRRSAAKRFWLHPSWARPDVGGECDVIPLHPATAEARQEVEELLA